MRFMFAGYAVAAAFELSVWLYGIERELLNVALRFWLVGAALGLWFAWRWFVKQDPMAEDYSDRRDTDSAPTHIQDPMARGISVARDISRT